jgi:hypothetical protein
MGQDLTKDLRGIIPALWRVESIAAKGCYPIIPAKGAGKKK